MEDFLIGTQSSALSVSVLDLFSALCLSVLLSLGSVLTYQMTHRGLNYDRSFLVTLVMVAPIVSVIILLIGSNLTLSLGMVGALSIIRFRTVIKDSRDMIFLFWSIAIGLGCGTYNWMITSFAAVFMAVVWVTLNYFQYGRSKASDFILVVKGQKSDAVPNVKEIVRQRVANSEVRSFDVEDDRWEWVAQLRLKNGTTLSEREFIQELNAVEGVEKVSLLAPQLALPV